MEATSIRGVSILIIASQLTGHPVWTWSNLDVIPSFHQAGRGIGCVGHKQLSSLTLSAWFRSTRHITDNIEICPCLCGGGGLWQCYNQPRRESLIPIPLASFPIPIPSARVVFQFQSLVLLSAFRSPDHP